MPAAPPNSVSFLGSLLILAIGGSVVAAWVWALRRLATHQPILPPATPRLVPWGGRSVLAVALVWLSTQDVVRYGFVQATRGSVTQPKEGNRSLSPFEILTVSALHNAATLIVVPLVLAATAGAVLGDFGLRPGGIGRELARGIVAYPLLAPLIFGVMSLSVAVWRPTAHPLQEAILRERSPSSTAIMILAGVILAPAAEELLFRGVLLGWLTRLALKPPIASPSELPADDDPATRPDLILDGSDVVLSGPPRFDPNRNLPAPPIRPGSEVQIHERAWPLFLGNLSISLIFAGMHYPVWPTPIPLFFLSLGLGWLYQRTGSILAPLALHMTLNGTSTLLMFLTVGSGEAAGVPEKKPLPPTPITPPAWVVVAEPNSVISSFRKNGPKKWEAGIDRETSS